MGMLQVDENPVEKEGNREDPEVRPPPYQPMYGKVPAMRRMASEVLCLDEFTLHAKCE